MSDFDWDAWSKAQREAYERTMKILRGIVNGVRQDMYPQIDRTKCGSFDHCRSDIDCPYRVKGCGDLKQAVCDEYEPTQPLDLSLFTADELDRPPGDPPDPFPHITNLIANGIGNPIDDKIMDGILLEEAVEYLSIGGSDE